MNRPPPADEPNLIDALWRVVASVLATIEHRIELASLEIGEAGSRLVLTLVASLAALGMLCAALFALSAWLAYALWPTLGGAVFGWIALGYLLIGGGLLLWLRAHLRAAPQLLADTLAELRNDAQFIDKADKR
ncbi:MAG TPA: phage holin family protein [Burkholderiaceae bacterium]|jgi:uncharacterized membrane protein YqjE